MIRRPFVRALLSGLSLAMMASLSGVVGVVGVGSTTAPAAAADPPPAPVVGQTVKAAIPSYANDLVTVDKTGIAQMTKEGTVTQAFGYSRPSGIKNDGSPTGNPPPEQAVTQNWATYSELAKAPTATDLAGVTASTPADLNGDGLLDMVYLAPSKNKLYITATKAGFFGADTTAGNLADGLGSIRSIDIETGAIGIAAPASATGVRDAVLVLYADRIRTMKLDGNFVPQWSVVSGMASVLRFSAIVALADDTQYDGEARRDLQRQWPTNIAQTSRLFAFTSNYGLAVLAWNPEISGGLTTVTVVNDLNNFPQIIDLAPASGQVTLAYDDGMYAVGLRENGANHVYSCGDSSVVGGTKVSCVELKDVNDTKMCEGSRVPSVAVTASFNKFAHHDDTNTDDYRFNAMIGCSTVIDGATKDQLKVQYAFKATDFNETAAGVRSPQLGPVLDVSPARQHDAGDGATTQLAIGATRAVFGCLALPASAELTDCRNAQNPELWSASGPVSIITTLTSDGKVLRTNDSWFNPGTVNDPRNILEFWWTQLSTTLLPAGEAPLVTQLPTVEQEFTLKITSVTGDRDAKPIPLAYLVAPPYVAGANQSMGAPAMVLANGIGTSSSIRAGGHVTGKVGVSAEFSFGAKFEAEATVAVDTAFTQEFGVDRAITFSEAYSGAPGVNAVVYEADTFRIVKAELVGSTMGIGLGTTDGTVEPMSVEVILPTGRIIKTGAVTDLVAKDLASTGGKYWGPDGLYGPVLASVFSAKPGNPSTYLKDTERADKATKYPAIDTYCDGSTDPNATLAEREVVMSDNRLNHNPVVDNPLFGMLKNAGKDILVGARHQVSVDNTAGGYSSFAIDNTFTDSFGTDITIDVNLRAVVASVVMEGTVGVSMGGTTSRTLTSGMEFQSGQVGQILPAPAGDSAAAAMLAREPYSWRAFLCHKTVTTTVPKDLPMAGKSIPVTGWVLNYAVYDYDPSQQGGPTGGLEALDPVSAQSPSGTAVVNPNSTALTWSQPSGSVRQYDWQVEPVGVAASPITGKVSYADVAAGNARPDTSTVGVGQALIPNQLYRWRVSATDFFGNVTTSDWTNFTTDGAPQAKFTPSATSARPGVAVSFANISKGGSSPTYTWDFGDGSATVTTTDAGTAQTHAYNRVGAYVVTLTATNTFGSTSHRETIVVTDLQSDQYAVNQGLALTVPVAAGVLVNDGSASDAVVTTAPSHGTLALATDGSFTYKPEAAYCGVDQFDYTAAQGGAKGTATAKIVVACGALPASVPVTSKTGSLVATGNLLAGLPSTGEAWTVKSLAQPVNGSASYGATGEFTFTPKPGWCGTESIPYTATSGYQTYSGAANVSVACVKLTAVADKLTLKKGAKKLALKAPGVLRNDLGQPGLKLSAKLVKKPAAGILRIRTTGQVVYKLATLPRGKHVYSATYQLRDSSGRTAIGKIKIVVSGR